MTRAARVARVVSGGQTGVDRAALDVALTLGIPGGGWCPAGRRAEDGPIPDRYPLRETPSPDPAQRTAWNVRDSDATLVLSRGVPGGGTLRTLHEAEVRGRPLLVLDLRAPLPERVVADWLAGQRGRVLNVAGPRESECVGIYDDAREYLLTHLDPRP